MYENNLLIDKKNENESILRNPGHWVLDIFFSLSSGIFLLIIRERRRKRTFIIALRNLNTSGMI